MHSAPRLLRPGLAVRNLTSRGFPLAFCGLPDSGYSAHQLLPVPPHTLHLDLRQHSIPPPSLTRQVNLASAFLFLCLVPLRPASFKTCREQRRRHSFAGQIAEGVAERSGSSVACGREDVYRNLLFLRSLSCPISGPNPTLLLDLFRRARCELPPTL